MKRLTIRTNEASISFDCESIGAIVRRLAAIEDILGDEYELDRLRELLEDIRARPTVEAEPAGAVELQRVYPGCTFCLDDAAPALDWVFGLDHVLPGYRYCPMCGRPMTEEAAERLLARWRDAL